MDYFRKILPKSLTVEKEVLKNTDVYAVYNEKDNTKICYKNVEAGKNAIDKLKALKHTNIINIIKYDMTSNAVTLKLPLTYPLSTLKKINFQNICIFKFHMICTIGNVILFLERCGLSHGLINEDSVYVNSDGRIVLGNFENCIRGKNELDVYMFFQLVNELKLEFKRHSSSLEKYETLSHYTHDPFDVEKASKSLPKPLTEEEKMGLKTFELKLNNFSTITEIYDILMKTSSTTVSEFCGKVRLVFEKNIYNKFETSLMKFRIFNIYQKEIFLDFLNLNGQFWYGSIVDKIIDLYVQELDNESPRYKEKIMKMFFNLNINSSYDDFIDKMFEIMDSQVRLFLLKADNMYGTNIISRMSDWNKKSFDSIILGVKCSDFRLQHETIKFLNKIFAKLNSNNQKEVIKNIHIYAKNDEIIHEGIDLVENNFEIIISHDKSSSMMKYMYKFILTFFSNEYNRSRIIDLLSKLFTHFEPKKLQSEVLPTIIYFLSEKDVQDKCFNIISDILNFLKINKQALLSASYVKGITTAFGKMSASLSQKNLLSFKNDTKTNNNPQASEKTQSSLIEYIPEPNKKSISVPLVGKKPEETVKTKKIINNTKLTENKSIKNKHDSNSSDEEWNDDVW
ncbi:SCY1 protein kinase [Edhazardia aedis USNM 41457]|uniref:SCY1 protein kinase n=1 Tax=Edhazardia aedis (strain USNM 41457) TaxID=1003232 RepID=J8ZZP6_EDHAE|nr:SCY1 protein kinase [Edhazardia aedis USNM 41457]|eukprot:EJW05103.1 SCY1 protein kinase [Edhazardia aedis USNM 41457]